MIKIGVIGAAGRMGQKILEILNEQENIKISAAIDLPTNSLIGKKVSQANSLLDGNKHSKNLNLLYSSDLNLVINNIDILIDFTTPNATLANLEIVKNAKKAIIIGTTGFSNDQIAIIKDAAKEIPIVFSPNMSIGVNVFFKILNDTAKLLNDYDIELVEIHHNKKKDSPSGTAIKLAEIVTTATKKMKKNWVYGREGIIGERTKEEIGIHSVRLGDIVGEHTVYFCGNNERLELTHRAHSRDNFASGAVRAAKWIYNKPNGLYDMFDVLELK